MVNLVRSSIDPRWLEVQENGQVVQEVEVHFPLYKIPRSFPSVEEALRWLRETERKQAKGRAYRLISSRSYPSTVLFEKLREKGYAEPLCQEIVQELQQLGYVQDEEFVVRMIEREFARGVGPRLIEMKIQCKGLKSDSVRQYISEARQKDMIRRLSSKLKLERRKKIQTLARKGFDLEILLNEIR